MMKIKRIIYFTLCCILYNCTAFALNSSLADPDLIAAGYEFNGAPSAKVGNFFQLNRFYFGGFLEARNEKRFDQAPLPNHNWRGFAFLYYKQPVPLGTKKRKWLYLGYEHESAHSTMGFYEHNDEAYEMIYDNYYRNINLNSLLLRYTHSLSKKNCFMYMLDYQFFFLGKNTPELHNHDLAQGHGFSAGMQYTKNVYRSASVYFALFGRYIFQSKSKRNGYIYYDNNETVEQRYEAYPVINDVYTVTAKFGLVVDKFITGRKLNIYAKVLYGNIFGFVDSREKRLVFAGGVEIVQ